MSTVAKTTCAKEDKVHHNHYESQFKFSWPEMMIAKICNRSMGADISAKKEKVCPTMIDNLNKYVKRS